LTLLEAHFWREEILGELVRLEGDVAVVLTSLLLNPMPVLIFASGN
jgi:hypothetical protein